MGFMTLMAIGKTRDIWAAVELLGIIIWSTMLKSPDPSLNARRTVDWFDRYLKREAATTD